MQGHVLIDHWVFQRNKFQWSDGSWFVNTNKMSAQAAKFFLQNEPRVFMECMNNTMCNNITSNQVKRHHIIMNTIRNMSDGMLGIPSNHKCLGMVVRYDFHFDTILFVPIPCYIEFLASSVCMKDISYEPRFVDNFQTEILNTLTQNLLYKENTTTIMKLPKLQCPHGAFATTYFMCFNFFLLPSIFSMDQITSVKKVLQYEEVKVTFVHNTVIYSYNQSCFEHTELPMFIQEAENVGKHTFKADRKRVVLKVLNALLKIANEGEIMLIATWHPNVSSGLSNIEERGKYTYSVKQYTIVCVDNMRPMSDNSVLPSLVPVRQFLKCTEGFYVAASQQHMCNDKINYNERTCSPFLLDYWQDNYCTGVCKGLSVACGNKCISLDDICDLKPDCGAGGWDERLCDERQLNYTSHLSQIRLFTEVSDLANKTYNIKCSLTNETFSSEFVCQYDLDHDLTLKHCPSGVHLVECRHIRCLHGFRCYLSYCIPLHMICDGKEDCMLGEDEVMCDDFQIREPVLLCRSRNMQANNKGRR